MCAQGFAVRLMPEYNPFLSDFMAIQTGLLAYLDIMEEENVVVVWLSLR